MHIVLASTSPRRRELLELLGLPFQIIPPTCEELLSPNLSPNEQTRQLARDKAQSVANQHTQDLVIGSVLETERAVGKFTLITAPAEQEEYFRRLEEYFKKIPDVARRTTYNE